MAPRVFLITGTSTGFGEELVKVVLKNGDYAVATARNSSKLKFNGANDTNSLMVDLDVTDKSSIDKAFQCRLTSLHQVLTYIPYFLRQMILSRAAWRQNRRSYNDIAGVITATLRPTRTCCILSIKSRASS